MIASRVQAGWRRGAVVSPVQAVQAPSLGRHNSVGIIEGQGVDPLTLNIGNTQASGSGYVAFLAGFLAHLTTGPTDNKGNGAMTKRGTDQGYPAPLWPEYGCRAYANLNRAGGTGHVFSVDKHNSYTGEEISLAVFEVIGGSSIVQNQGSAASAGAGQPYAGPAVDVNGPALILSMWTGDGDVGDPYNPKDVAVDSEWQIIESLFLSGTPYIQYAVALRIVSSAGTYFPTWTPVTSQGAGMHTVAIVA